MKRLAMLFLTAMLLAGTGTAVFAQEEDTGLGMGFGAKVGYERVNLGVKYGGAELDYNANLVSVGLFFDATYLRLSLMYSTNLGNIEYEADSGVWPFSGSGDFDGKWSNLDLELLGKFPIGLKVLSIWPAIGASFSYNLKFQDSHDNDVWSDPKMHDLYLLAGAGVDINILGGVYLSPSLIFGYNLTPMADDDFPNSADWHGWKLSLNLAAGIRI